VRPNSKTFRILIKGFGTSKNPEKKAVGVLRAPLPKRVPVIVSTDLFYPPIAGREDDYLDVALLVTMPEVEVKGVILDNAAAGEQRPQESRPGANAMAALETVLRRRTPAFLGLERPLAGVDDKGTSGEAHFQAGVAFILKTLRATAVPVTIVTLGSLRDVAAAFNREPALFREKVGKLVVFAGEAASTAAGMASASDYNVELDRNAFVAVMRSGLPIYWVPRQDGGETSGRANNAGHASVWTARLGDALAPLTGPPLQFFVNAVIMPASNYVQKMVCCFTASQKTAALAAERDLRAGAVLATIIDKTVTFVGDNAALAPGSTPPGPGAVFGFSPADVSFSDRGYVTGGPGAGAKRVNSFNRLVDQGTYSRAMSKMTGKMLERMMPVPN
jgi:hypothetical protein